MFRICSLWFNNSERKEISAQLVASLARIPSSKFLPLIYQIASRLGGAHSQPVFQNALNKVLLIAASDHPHHILYHLFALANGNCIPNDQRGKSGFIVDQEKVSSTESMTFQSLFHHALTGFSRIDQQIKKNKALKVDSGCRSTY